MPVQFLPFGPWTPDRSDFNTEGTEQALNVIRTSNGYRPFSSLEYFSSSDDLPAGIPVGFFWARDDVTQLAVQWAVIDDSEGNGGVYELVTEGVPGPGSLTPSTSVGAASWTGHQASVALTGSLVALANPAAMVWAGPTPLVLGVPNQSWVLRQGLPGGLDVTSLNRWRPAQFQNRIYVANFDNNLMSKLISSGTTTPNFDAVEFTPTEAAPVKVRYLAAVRDFLVGGYCDDPTFTDPAGRIGGFHPDRVRWSAIGDAENWSLEGDADVLSDFQDLPDAGEVRGIIGGEYGIILCENGLFRMDFVGPPNIFTFNRIERARGCLEPNSVVAANNIVYYLAADGWRSFDGQRINPIGAEKFDRWFFATADPTALSTMTRAVDPNNQLIVWGFNSDLNTNDINDRMLIYNYTLQEASYSNQDHVLVGTFISPGFTLEGLDSVSSNIDLLPASLDSESYVSQEQSFGGLVEGPNTNQYRLHTFTGKNLEAIIDTSEQRLGGDLRVRVRKLQTAIEGDDQTIEMQIAGRNRLGITSTFGRRTMITGDGSYMFNGDARYQRARANITGEWRDATGVFVFFEKTSMR